MSDRPVIKGVQMREKVNIVYTRPLQTFGPLSSELTRMINAVSPRVRVWDVAQLVFAEGRGDVSASQKLDAILTDTEIMFGFPPLPRLLVRAPRLKWIQSPLVGVEMFLTPDFINSPVILTNARGIHDQVAELAIMFALMFAKSSLTCTLRQYQKQWRRFTPGLLHSKTLGVLGVGNIGRKVARLAKAFHMKVIATEVREMKKPGYIDVLLPASGLPELLAESDYVIVAVPLTRQTAKLIGEKELRTMKPSAYLINVARGGIIDEAILVRALKENWIAGAGLDVFASEPLPVDSQLWDLQNVIITPHCAGLRDDYDILATKLFCKNLKRYLSGKELLNVVDKIEGY
jgi:D-2-hydroxyacid dehydrogenase (NADP+)